MFDFDAGKLILIGIVALIVIGPKDLPRVLRELGRATAKMRRMASEFQSQFMEAVREADMAHIRADVAKLSESAKLDVAAFDPVADVKAELKGAVERIPSAGSLSAPAGNAADPPKAITPQPGDGEDAPPASSKSEAREERADDASKGAPGKGIDAEMEALAEALKAEIGAEPRLGAPPPMERASTLHDNA